MTQAYNGMEVYNLTMKQVMKIGYIRRSSRFTKEPVMIKGASGKLDTIELYVNIKFYGYEQVSESTSFTRSTEVEVILKIVPDGDYYIIAYKPKNNDVEVSKKWVSDYFI